MRVLAVTKLRQAMSMLVRVLMIVALLLNSANTGFAGVFLIQFVCRPIVASH
jgi:hypothetical protein